MTRLSADAVVNASGEPAYEVTDGDVLRETLGLREDGGVTDGGPAWTGDGVGVAIVDSGIRTSGDLKQAQVTHFYDFTDGGAEVPDFDDYGHGTHVAGLIGGTGQWSDNLFEGPASDARLIGLKVLDANGQGYTSDVIAAISFAIENRAALGIDIINLSLGHPIFEPAASDPLVQAVEAAVAAGIVVVASAGNNGQSATGEVGYAGITSPGNAQSAITVGSVDTANTAMRGDDTVAAYSSRGPTWYDAYAKPDIVAPGHRLVAIAAKQSTLYDDHPAVRVEVHSSGLLFGDDAHGNAADYMRLTGTSMSAGVTSGVVALVLEASRAASGGMQLTPNAVKAVLQFTAIPLVGVDPLTQGAGGLNAVGAVRLAGAIDASAPEGAWWLGPPVAPVDIIAGATVSWAERIIWGGTVYTNEPAWGLGVVWDNRIIWGGSVIWGDDLDESVVWSNRIIWGTLASSPLQVTHVLID